MHIGAVAATDSVLRVLKLMPVSIKNKEIHNKGFYTTSTYAAMSDAEWKVEQESLAKELNKDKEEMIAEIDTQINNVLSI